MPRRRRGGLERFGGRYTPFSPDKPRTSGIQVARFRKGVLLTRRPAPPPKPWRMGWRENTIQRKRTDTGMKRKRNTKMFMSRMNMYRQASKPMAYILNKGAIDPGMDYHREWTRGRGMVGGNPYRDARGRFTSRQGAVTLRYIPKSDANIGTGTFTRKMEVRLRVPKYGGKYAYPKGWTGKPRRRRTK